MRLEGRAIPAAITVSLLLVWAMTTCPQERHQKDKPESMGDHYYQWLTQDVKYIITPEERSVFLNLTTDEERERFIEQFWRRRDPDPGSPDNKYKEEHYRRIQYANDVFAAGIPGWMTDRGRIYIMYGKPDRIETHPIGGRYQRRQEEGGGITSTYPFERWEYRYIEGIGDDIELEFVDYSGGNFYKLSKDPSEKDEFLHVPWAGNTDAENDPLPGQDPAEMRWARIAGFRPDGTTRLQGITGEMARYTLFARTELAASLQKPPSIRFKDLQSDVSARITYNLLPFSAHIFFLRMTGDSDLAPLTLQIPNESLSYENAGDQRRSRLQVYGRISGLSGITVFEFDDEIVNELTDAQWEAQKYSSSVYSRPLRLPPGRFKLTVMLKDAISGKLGSIEQGITAPGFPLDRPTASPVIVSSELLPVSSEDLKKDPYVFGRFRVRPRLDATFHKGENLGVYFEIYNIALDFSKAKPSVKVEYQIQNGKDEQVTPFRDVTRTAVMERDLIVIPMYIDISSLVAGQYTIVFRITDQVKNQTVESTAKFQIAA
jgi:GWxTD domain-containing protein